MGCQKKSPHAHVHTQVHAHVRCNFEILKHKPQAILRKFTQVLSNSGWVGVQIPPPPPVGVGHLWDFVFAGGPFFSPTVCCSLHFLAQYEKVKWNKNFLSKKLNGRDLERE